MFQNRHEIIEYHDKLINHIDFITERTLLWMKKYDEIILANTKRDKLICEIKEIQNYCLQSLKNGTNKMKFCYFIPKIERENFSKNMIGIIFVLDQRLDDKLIELLNKIFLDFMIESKNYHKIVIDENYGILPNVLMSMLENQLRAETIIIDLSNEENKRLNFLEINDWQTHQISEENLNKVAEFVNTESLKELKIITRRINCIPIELFSRFKNLTKIIINIRWNKKGYKICPTDRFKRNLKYFDSNICKDLENLLDLEINCINNLIIRGEKCFIKGDCFEKLPKLINLSICDVGLKKMQCAQLTKLKTFRFRINTFFSLESVFEGNFFEFINNMKDLNYLKLNLDFNGSELENICINSLNCLSVSVNQVTSFSKNFENLKFLELDYVKSMSSNSFDNLKNLEFLNIFAVHESVLNVMQSLKIETLIYFSISFKWEMGFELVNTKKVHEKSFSNFFNADSICLIGNNSYRINIEFKICESELDYVNSSLKVLDESKEIIIKSIKDSKKDLIYRTFDEFYHLNTNKNI
ncbi:unnamed protein product [Brachionus calyciflorus]|uniref:Uncharacterized protein n=1 Tax=Brachionus calyciflorus TaxID=104777 RepID=A0A814L4N0_9BILA|nr:unnamed protein product [Brachionus calyciflorus]